MLLDRSLRREMARQFGGSFTVLFSVVMTMMLIRLLGEASEGLANPQDLFLLIGLASLSYLQFILGLALFVAVLMSYSRMHRDAEMVIWAGAGVSPLRYFASALRFAAPVLAAIAVLTLVAWPWANRQSAALRDRFEQRSDLSRAAPGQFRQSASGSRVFFLGRGADAHGLARDVFIRDMEGGKETVTVAQAARIDTRDGGRFLMLSNGNRYTHAMDKEDFRIVGFKDMGIRLTTIASHPVAAAASLVNTPSREIPTMTLATALLPAWRGELSWRLGVPISTLLLVLMAVPLAAINPRTGRAIQLIVAVLIYLTYLNFLNAFQHWIESGFLRLGSGLLLLHGGALLLLLAMVARKGLLPRHLLARLADVRSTNP